MNRPRQRRHPSLDSETPPRPSADGGENRYAFLSQRAVEFVTNHDNAVDESQLIAHVFGAGGSNLWRSLLRQMA